MRCEHCDGTGVIEVWSPAAIRFAKGSDDAKGRLTTVAVACRCSLGNRWTERTKRDGSIVPWLPRFGSSWLHRKRQIRDRTTTDGGLYDVLADIADCKPPNHEPSFDQWNDG